MAGGSNRATPREVNQKKRHLPLRQLFARVPNRLIRLKPCWMMSPLAVSTYLESPEFQFDVVIFDEASQVLPWDAIGAVYRGRQLVVAGDQKQLPPLTFFDRMVNNDDSEAAGDLGDFGHGSTWVAALNKPLTLTLFSEDGGRGDKKDNLRPDVATF